MSVERIASFNKKFVRFALDPITLNEEELMDRIVDEDESNKREEEELMDKILKEDSKKDLDFSVEEILRHHKESNRQIHPATQRYIDKILARGYERLSDEGRSILREYAAPIQLRDRIEEERLADVALVELKEEEEKRKNKPKSKKEKGKEPIYDEDEYLNDVSVVDTTGKFYAKLYEEVWRDMNDEDIELSETFETLEDKYIELKRMFPDKKSHIKINRELDMIRLEMKDEVVREKVDEMLRKKSLQYKWENQKKLLNRIDINKLEYDSDGKPIFTTFTKPRSENWKLFENQTQARFFLSKNESSLLSNLTKKDLERYKNEVIDNVIEDLVDSADYEKQVDDVIESMVKTSREPISLYQTKDYFKLFGEPQSLWDIERKNPFI